MPYTKTTWTNETPATTPIKYRITGDSEGTITASGTIETVTSITAGTPLDSTNLNKIEQGIYDAMYAAEHVATSQLVNGVLSADTTGRAKMADTFITLTKLSANLRFQKVNEFIGTGSSHPDFTSIPGTFKHLLMIYNGVSSRVTSGWDDFYLRVNNDSGSSYNTALMLLNESGARWNWGVTNPHTNGLWSGVLPAQNAGYLPPGGGLVLFPDYAGTTYYKSAISFNVFNGSYGYGIIIANTHRTNAEAITRLTGWMPGSAYPRAGSVFSLYGFN